MHKKKTSPLPQQSSQPPLNLSESIANALSGSQYKPFVDLFGKDAAAFTMKLSMMTKIRLEAIEAIERLAKVGLITSDNFDRMKDVLFPGLFEPDNRDASK